MNAKIYDVIIIGAGVSGSCIARELSRYEGQFCVLEKEEDVCSGTSKANSGIVHAGYDAAAGSLKAKLNVQGSRMMEELSKELDFPYRPCGSLVACSDKSERKTLQRLLENGLQNGVEGLQILTDKEQIRTLEPHLSEKVEAVLYAPTAGIVCPFGLNIAMAENAAVNQVEFVFHAEVTSIAKEGTLYQVGTSNGRFIGRMVVNAAGVFADKLHNMVSKTPLQITPRRGEYCLLDKQAGAHVSRTIFSLPGAYGKGILVTPTVHGNLLLGPTAEDQGDRGCHATTAEGLKEVLEKAKQNVAGIPYRQVITSFAGLRAHEAGDDFVIQEPEDAEGFIDCAGIESPGLASSPAIGVMVAEMIVKKQSLKRKKDFVAKRTGILNPALLSKEERNQLIRKQPAYGTIVCRCETISEGEIIDAITRPLGAASLDGVKRRVRAGMGRCQGGFCAPKVMEIMERELHLTKEQIRKCGKGSYMVTGPTKGGGEESL